MSAPLVYTPSAICAAHDKEVLDGCGELDVEASRNGEVGQRTKRQDLHRGVALAVTFDAGKQWWKGNGR